MMSSALKSCSRIGVGLLVLSLFFQPRPSPAAQTPNPTTDELIAGLASDDASARQAAADRLVSMGDSVRTAVMAATHSGDPQTSSQAQQVLLRLPWYQSDDHPAVKQILKDYTTYKTPPPNADAVSHDTQRMNAADALAGLENFAGFPALIRLVAEDPDQQVRWWIVHDLRTHDDGSHLISLRRIDVPADNPPLEALCGLAWLDAGSPNAVPLFQEVFDAEFKQPGDQDPEVGFFVDCLVDCQIEKNKLNDAATLLRRQLSRDGAVDHQGTPKALLRLLTLQANFNSIPGVEDDLKLAAPYSTSGKVEYAVARIDLRLQRPQQAAAARQAAFAASSNSRLARFDAGRFLAENGWNDEAQAEFQAYLAMPLGDDQEDDDASDCNAHFDLAALAVDRGDDLTAAKEKEIALSLALSQGQPLAVTDAQGRIQPITQDEIRSEIQWHYYHAAEKQGDPAAAANHLKNLENLSPTDEEIATDIVPGLLSQGRDSEAQKFFQDAYAPAKAKLDADPANPGRMNDVAWLEAECRQNLDEALKLSTAAATALPDDSAIVDTEADVNFQLKNYDKAVQLEAKALSLDPSNAFMASQLAKFKAARDSTR